MIEKRLPLKNRLPFLMCLGIALLSLILFLLITDVLSERNGNAELMSRIAEFMPQAGMPGYEHFDLSKEDAKLLDKAIERWLKEPHYSPEDLTKIYVLLYIKHDTMPHDYISEAQRQIFIQKISQAAPENFDDKARQIRLLKYGLGINNISELKNPTNICERDNLFLDDFNWETLKGIDNFIEIINFCKIDHEEKVDLKRVNELLLTADSASREHFDEHGLNNVPVYVNDCSLAKNSNETYHCLYFENAE